MSVTARTGTYDGTGPQPLFATCASGVGVRRVADRGVLRALSAWAARTGLSHDALDALDSDDVRLDPATTARVAAQLRRVGQVLRSVDVPALGWGAPGGVGLVGGVLGADLTGDPGALLRSEGGFALWASSHPQPHLRLTGQDGRTWMVTGWRTVGEAVRPAGSQVALPGAAGRLLVAVGGPDADVVAAPATSVAAGLLTTLYELALSCASSGSVLRVGAGRPVG